jgi:hypothetical protein
VLRGAQMHSAVRAVSFLVPLDERPSRIWHPKRPSTVHRPMSELRSRYVDKVQRNVRDPKIPSETRRPTSEPRWSPSVKLRHGFKPRRAHLRTLASHRSASRPSVRLQRPVQAPKSSSATNRLDLQPRVEPSRELPSRVRPPKRPSTKHRLTFQLRGTFLQASAHVQAPKNPFMKHRPAFGTREAFLQASEPHPSSEEPFNETSAHDPAPRGLLPSIKPASSLRRDRRQVVNPFSSSGVEPSSKLQSASGLRRSHQQNIGLPSRPEKSS